MKKVILKSDADIEKYEFPSELQYVIEEINNGIDFSFYFNPSCFVGLDTKKCINEIMYQIGKKMNTNKLDEVLVRMNSIFTTNCAKAYVPMQFIERLYRADKRVTVISQYGQNYIEFN